MKFARSAYTHRNCRHSVLQQAPMYLAPLSSTWPLTLRSNSTAFNNLCIRFITRRWHLINKVGQCVIPLTVPDHTMKAPGRQRGTALLILNLSTRVVNFMPQCQSLSFGEEKILLSVSGIRSCKISRVYSDTELFCKDNGHPDLQTLLCQTSSCKLC